MCRSVEAARQRAEELRAERERESRRLRGRLRAARRLLPINSFWISGTGNLPDGFTSADNASTTVLHALREATLRNDGPAWAQAWQALDAGAIKTLLEQARRGEPVELTLCGETTAQTFTLQPQGLWTRLSNRFASADIPALLQSL